MLHSSYYPTWKWGKPWASDSKSSIQLGRHIHIFPKLEIRHEVDSSLVDGSHHLHCCLVYSALCSWGIAFARALRLESPPKKRGWRSYSSLKQNHSILTGFFTPVSWKVALGWRACGKLRRAPRQAWDRSKKSTAKAPKKTEIKARPTWAWQLILRAIFISISLTWFAICIRRA